MLPLVLLSASIAASGPFAGTLVNARTLRAGGVVTGSGRAPPPTQEHSAVSRRPIRQRPRPPVRVISEFDSPDGFRPQGNPYRGVTFETATEQEIVSGPPQGDDFLERYLRRVEEQRQTRLANSSGFVANGRWQGDPVKGLLQTPPVPRVRKAAVVLNSPSARVVNGQGFAPNGGWSGQPETGLLEYVPDSRRRPLVSLPAPSTAIGPGAFAPNSGWQGDRETGLARPFTIRNGVVDQSPLRFPSPFSSHPTAFSPSSWLTDRQNLLQTGARRPRPQEEVEVITLDNIDDWLRQQPASRPDTFNINVATVINTRGHQGSGIV